MGDGWSAEGFYVKIRKYQYALLSAALRGRIFTCSQ